MKKCGIFIIFLFFSITVRASELSEVETMTEVFIKVVVPDNFTENIVFQLEQKETNIRFSYSLTTENIYSGKLYVTSGIYYPKIIFSNSQKYDSTLLKEYDITGDSMELFFNIKEKEEKSFVEVFSSSSDKAFDEDFSAEEIFCIYQEKVSIMKDNSDFDSFLSLYSGEMFQKYYLELDTHTIEQWDKLSKLDRFNYYMIYKLPYTKIMNYEFEREEDFLEELITPKTMLSQIKNGDIVYDAIVDLWKWHYAYWQHTGTFYSFLDYLSDSAKEELKKETLVEEEFVKEKVEQDKGDRKGIKKSILSWMQENLFTVLIFISSGIAFLIVSLHNRKKIERE